MTRLTQLKPCRRTNFALLIIACFLLQWQQDMRTPQESCFLLTLLPSLLSRLLAWHFTLKFEFDRWTSLLISSYHISLSLSLLFPAEAALITMPFVSTPKNYSFNISFCLEFVLAFCQRVSAPRVSLLLPSPFLLAFAPGLKVLEFNLQVQDLLSLVRSLSKMNWTPRNYVSQSV